MTLANCVRRVGLIDRRVQGSAKPIGLAIVADQVAQILSVQRSPPALIAHLAKFGSLVLVDTREAEIDQDWIEPIIDHRWADWLALSAVAGPD